MIYYTITYCAILLYTIIMRLITIITIITTTLIIIQTSYNMLRHSRVLAPVRERIRDVHVREAELAGPVAVVLAADGRVDMCVCIYIYICTYIYIYTEREREILYLYNTCIYIYIYTHESYGTILHIYIYVYLSRQRLGCRSCDVTGGFILCSLIVNIFDLAKQI